MRPLPTWRYTPKMAGYAPWLYLLHAMLWSVMMFKTWQEVDKAA